MKLQLSQPTRSSTLPRQQTTCLLSTTCIWVHTRQRISVSDRTISTHRIAPPTVRNVGVDDFRSSGMLPRPMALSFYLCTLLFSLSLTAVSLPHAAQLTSAVPSMKTIPVSISRRDAFFTSVSHLKCRNAFPRGL